MIKIANKSHCKDILNVMFSTKMSRESTWWNNSEESIAKRLDEGCSFIKIINEKVVGTVNFKIDNDTVIIRGLAVRPEYEKQGIATELMNEIEKTAKSMYKSELLLAVSRSNINVISFYEKLGFHINLKLYKDSAPNRPKPIVMTKDI